MRNATIDVFRGVAILAVLFHHFFFVRIYELTTFGDSSVLGLSPLALNNGWLGVSLFFVLSGMVLYRPRIIASGASLIAYYRARCLRLLPLYFMFVFFIVIVGDHDARHFVFYELILLSGLHDLIPAYWSPAGVLPIFWSLGVEILFSALLPALLLAIARFGFPRVLATIVVGAFVYRIVGDHLWFALHPDYDNRFINPLKDNIFGRLDDFLVGMATARLSRRDMKIPPISAILALFGLLVVGNAWSYLSYEPRTMAGSVLASALHLIFSLSIAAVLLWVREWRIWSAALFAPLAYAGTTCYAAYMTHAVLLAHDRDWTSGRWAFAPLKFGAFVIVTFAISGVLYVFVEASGIRKLPGWALWVLGRGGVAPMESEEFSAETRVV